MLIYFLKGKLPWSGKDFKNKTFEKVKSEGFFDVDKICEGVPTAFKEMLITARNLSFDEEPPYVWYRKRLQMLMKNKKIQDDGIFDWMVLKKHREDLKVSKYIPSLRLESDRDILKELYEPQQGNVDLDEVGSKYGRIHGESDLSVDRPARNISLSVEENPMKFKIKQKKSGCFIM